MLNIHCNDKSITILVMSMQENVDYYFSKTLEKGLVILRLFDRDHTRLSLAEIARSTGINTTSTYRYVNTLVRLGYLKKHPNTKLLKLGNKALILGHNFLNSFDLLYTTKPLIDKFFRKHTVTIDTVLREGFSLIAFYRREAPNTIFFRQPLISKDLHVRATGKAVLAQFSDEEVARFFDKHTLERHTSHTLTTKKQLLADIEATRTRGYSINNEEYMVGLISIAAPLMNFQTHTVVGAVSLDFPASEISLQSIEQEYPGPLTKLANELSEIMTMAEHS